MKTLGLVAMALGGTFALMSAATPVLAAPQCVEMRFLDAQGVVIPVNPPLIGIVIGDRPLFEGAPPPYAQVEAGRFVGCPEVLVENSRKTFVESCSTDERRQAAATANGADISLVNQRCAELSNALTN